MNHTVIHLALDTNGHLALRVIPQTDAIPPQQGALGNGSDQANALHGRSVAALASQNAVDWLDDTVAPYSGRRLVDGELVELASKLETRILADGIPNVTVLRL